MYATIPQVRDFYTQKAHFSKNEWVHLTMTYVEKKGVTYYIDGKMRDFVAEDRTLQAFKDILVGRNVWNNKLIADIDNLFIWNRALNDKEVALIAATSESDLSNMILSYKSKSPFRIITLGVGILIILIGVALLSYKRRQYPPFQSTQKVNKNEDRSTLSAELDEISNIDDLSKEDTSVQFKERLDEIIMANLSSSEFQIKELATEMGLSRTVLYNLCAEYLNESPKQYIRNIRLDQAKTLLTETDKPIVQIMDETGFESRAYFAKCIKERFGVTPAALRKIP